MGNIQIKNVPDDVHEEVRRRAAEAGSTLRDYVLRLIRADQALPTTAEWLAQVAAREPVDLSGVDVAALIREGREERAADLLGALGDVSE